MGNFFLPVVTGILPAVFFFQDVFTYFFNDFDLSKWDEQVKPSMH